jgi:peptide/nickel transport system substrate-binding protein
VPTAPPTVAPTVATTEAAEAEAPAASVQDSGEPITYVMPGEDWGYPSPFAFYNRGPGYLRMAYIFDTLVWKDEQGYIPWLATDWQVSEDGLTWTFALRQGVTWQDGAPFTAEDVAFTYEYFKAKTAEGMVKWGWPVDKIASVAVSDDGRSVVFVTDGPRAGVLGDLFGSLPINPKHIWEGVDDPLQKLDEEAVIGTGMFRLREYSKDEGRYVYEANPDFFLGAPSVDELIFVKVQDAALALLANELDEAGFSGKEIVAVQQVEGQQGLEIAEGPSDWVLKLYINTSRAPLDDKAVRQALAYAIDRQAIVDKAEMGGAIVASTGILSPGTYWHNPNLPTYDYAPETAQALLDQAGIAPFEVTLLTTSTYAREAELIMADLAKVGITVKVETADRSTVDSMLSESNYSLLITGHRATANPDNGDPSPTSAWTNVDYSAAYEMSTVSIDDEVRRSYVWTMQEILAEELPVLALWHPMMWEVYYPGKAVPFYTPEGVGGGIPTATNKLMFIPER